MTPRSGPVGPARILALAYGFFALAAGARSAVQLGTHAHRAPLAYALSALAALVYLAGAVVLGRAERSAAARPLLRWLCLTELTGVVVIGSLSVARSSLFPEATVWSHYGSGYGYVPLALPLLALWWLHRAH